MRRSIAIALVSTLVAWSARGRACEKCESRSSDDAQIRSATLVIVAKRLPPKRYGVPFRHDYRVFVRKVLKGGFGSKELHLKYESAMCEPVEEIQGDSTAALLVPSGDGAYRPLLKTCGSTYLAVVGKKIAVDGRWLTFDEFTSKYGPRTTLPLRKTPALQTERRRSRDFQQPARSLPDLGAKASTEARQDAATPMRAFSGIGGFGREAQAFLPCGLSQKWWLEFDARWPELDKALAEQDKADLLARMEECDRKTGLFGCEKWVYLELDGIPSVPGQYGHMGGYSRELRVEKVLRVARYVPSDCEVRRLTGR